MKTLTVLTSLAIAAASFATIPAHAKTTNESVSGKSSSFVHLPKTNDNLVFVIGARKGGIKIPLRVNRKQKG